MKMLGLQDVSDELIAGLRADYPSGTCAETATAQALRERFSSFGIEAARHGRAARGGYVRRRGRASGPLRSHRWPGR